MRIVKKLYTKDAEGVHVLDGKTLLASRLFDDVISRIGLPMNFSRLEFSFGYDFTFVENGIAAVGIDLDDPLMDSDSRIISTLIRMELFRAFYRKSAIMQIPRIVEDVVIAREMIKRGYAEDLVYLFYNFMLSHRIRDSKDFLRFNLPWIVFNGYDKYYSELFLNTAKGKIRKRYEAKMKRFMDALSKDLSDEKNLEKAVSLYGGIDAGD